MAESSGDKIFLESSKGLWFRDSQKVAKPEPYPINFKTIEQVRYSGSPIVAGVKRTRIYWVSSELCTGSCAESFSSHLETFWPELSPEV